MGQMYSLVKDLTKKGLIESYQKVLEEHLQLKFIEEEPTNECHFLPHHDVKKDSETTP